MPIRRTSNKAEIRQWVDARIELLTQQLTQALHNVGLEAVRIARLEHKYVTRTGNLQSSIGYCIVIDGQIYDENFQKVSEGNPTTDGSEGANAAQTYARSIASKESEGMQLIVVAGMPYAQYVEAMGLDVLDSAEIYAKNDIAKKIKDVMQLWKQ